MFIVQAQRLNSVGVLWIKSWAQGPHMCFEMNTIGFPDPVPALLGRGWGVSASGLNFMESVLLGDPVLGLVRTAQLNCSEVTGGEMSWAGEKGGDCLEGSMSELLLEFSFV